MPVRRPPGPSREQIRRRRVLALGAIAGALVAVVVAVVVALPHVHESHALPPPPPAPRQFRIVFPEGFTRAQMAGRVQRCRRDRAPEEP